jgi:hypothetical protein
LLTLVLYCYNQIIIKLDWLKSKKFLLIVFAIVFLVSLFLIKNNFLSDDQSRVDDALSYDEGLLVNFINKDADQDGMLDWEESLWGTDPNNKDTDGDGVLDDAEIAEIKKERGINTVGDEDPNNLTQTEKFSRELFATVATLSQAGEIDQATADKLSSSLAEQIKNSAPERVYTSSNLSLTNDNSSTAVSEYNQELGDLYEKFEIEKGAVQILQEAMSEDGTIDAQGLEELDPLIEKVEGIVLGMLQVKVPSQLASTHLKLTNATQRCLEDFKNMKFYETDPIVALGGISSYQKNSILIDEATNELHKAIWQKIKN